MADDINLPNLVSHLQVNLGNTSGLVADATRQGSSVGAAIGESMQLQLRAAIDDIPDVEINGDSSELDRDLHRVRGELQQLANQRIGVDISIEDALRQMERLEPHLERLERQHPNINVRAAVGDALADLQDLRDAARQVDDIDPDIDVDIDVHDIDDLDRGLGRVRASLGRVAGVLGPLAGIAAPFAKAGLTVGALLPLLAGVVSVLTQIAPAAAVGVSALLAVQLASGTVKLAMVGVGEAVKAALDPSDAEAYAEALKKLSPNARAFVGEIHKLQPTLDKIRKTVQDRVFAGLDKQVTATAKSVLPSLKTALLDTGSTLNSMAKGALVAAQNLGDSGILGTALKGATRGLANFQRAPGQIVTALGQIGAAAAPSFERLTKAGGGALDRLSEKLSRAFESGRMQKAIETAISTLEQLGRIAGNIFGGIGNIIKAVSVDGAGLFSTMERVTQAFQDVTATKAFQDALRALSQTVSVLVATLLPLVTQALGVLLPIFQILAPPIQTLIKALGAELQPVIAALGPVLAALAEAFAKLIPAVTPFITLALQLIADILPILTPLFVFLADVFERLTPIAQQLADNIAAQLTPILAVLPGILEQILPQFLELADRLLPLLLDILVQLGPQLDDLAVQLADLLVQLAPLIVKFLELQVFLLDKMMPIIGPLAQAIGGILVGSLMLLTDFLSQFAIPAIKAIVALLSGDFHGAMVNAATFVNNLRDNASKAFEALKTRGVQLVGQLASDVVARVQSMAAGFARGVSGLVSDAVHRIGQLPGQIVGVLGNLDNLLYAAGARIISGFVAGIRASIPSVQGVLSNITSMIPEWKGPRRKDAVLLTPAGRAIIKGLVAGIDASTASLKSKLGQVTALIEKAISANAGNKRKVGGLGALLARVHKDNGRLLVLARARDAVTARLKAAQTKLTDVLKQRDKASADIREGILSEANITTGNPLVNSVTAITVGLQQALKKTQEFAANIARLKKAGLRGDLLQQIADAGVSGGAATAAALAKATPAELKRINDLQSQLAAAASKTGSTVAGALFDAGVQAARGLVEGLKRQQGAIVRQMEKIGAAMVASIKKALKIHSPSRVSWGIGERFGDGLVGGIRGMRAAVAAASASLASAAVGAADVAARAVSSVPAPGALTAALATSAGGGDTTNNFYLSGGDATPDGILRALSWQGLVGGTSG